MRIAIVTTYPPGAGSLNEYAFHFVRALRFEPDVESVILLTDELPNNQPYPTFHTVGSHISPMTAIPCWRFGAWDNAWRIMRTVRRIKPDIVLFNIQFASFGSSKAVATLGLLTPAIVAQLGFPTLVLLHNIMETVDLQSAGFAGNPAMAWVIRQVGNLVTRMILSADLVALTIPKYVEILAKKYQCDNVLLAPHGSFDEIVAQPAFDLPPGPRQIMAFGKFGTYKKVEDLVEAAMLLAARGHGPLEVVIAGTDSPNAAGYLKGIRQRYQNQDFLRFTGYVSEEDVPRIFSEAAVVVFPYTSTTGSSGVLHQAGNYGKAAVLPRIGDFAEVIAEEGYDGEFFEPDNVESLAAAIARVLDDDNRRRELGARNFAAAQGLPLSAVVEWYLVHFESMLAARKRPRPTM